MRIAILHYTKPPVIGGVERVIRDQAQALSTLGHDVTIMTRSDMERRRFVGIPAAANDSSALHGPFLHPSRAIDKHRHGLPHWHQDGVWCFITWRLADSLPCEFIDRWMAEREAWMLEHPQPWAEADEAAYHQRFSEDFMDRLDAGHGSCLLRDAECASAVEQALRFFDGERYVLKSFVVMPNHVHVLVRLHDGWPMEQIVQNWKERSAKSINTLRGTQGQVWQKGYFDRLVRSAEHWEFVAGYVERNPAAAGLKDGYLLWSADESSAYKLGMPTNRRRSIDESFDAIIVHNVFTMPFDLEWTQELIQQAAATPQIRWINWVHDVRWCEKVPQAVHIAVSEHRKGEYAKHTSAPIHVIPNGVNHQAILGLTDRISALQLEKAGLVLFHPTRFVRRKNIEMGLRVLSALPQALYIVTAAPDPHQGDGRLYYDELIALAEKLGVRERVLFLGETGTLSDDDVRSLYQMADALFFPSTQEGYGLPLIEAALHGLPVLCSDIPPHREVAVGAEFFALDEGPQQIAARLREHPALRQRQLRRGLIRRLSCEGIVRELLEPLLLPPGAP